MKQYRVTISKSALTDMEEIYDYISEELKAPGNAMKQYERIAKAIETLEFFPERCKCIEDKFLSAHKLRILIADRYSVIFTIQDNSVIVVRVLYSASDINQRLLSGR
ncbi:MAG: type II toxin-antitoxin system RelE/ParE family toxin [Firmicutes bacterium]|nr:type II toxin-antitoxin system RelE/ParE family toxin [Bacillota bacterium]